MSARRPVRLAAALTVTLAAGCGDPNRAAAPPTTTTAAGEVRSAEHDARDAGALAPEPQGAEPNKGTPGAQDATGGKVDAPILTGGRFTTPMRVRVGQIVVFTNDDEVPHSVRAIGRSRPASGAIAPGGRFEYTPLRPGRVVYRCGLHPRMRGVLEVRAAISR